MNVMMTLGAFKFMLATAVYQELKRSTAYRWPKQDRFGQAPVRQFVGAGDDTISLPGVVFPGWQGGRGQVDAMRAMAAQGQPLTLVGGDGTVMGRWVVESIEETQTVFAAAGAALRQEFNLSLAKFDDQAPKALTLGGLASLASLGSATDQAAGAAGAADALGGSIGASLGSAVATIQGVANQVKTNLAPVIVAVRQGMTVAANLRNTAKEAQALVKRVGKIKSLADAEGALGSLMRVSSSASAASTGAGRVLNGTLGQMVTAGEPPAAVAAVKGALVTMNKLTTGLTAIRKQTDGIVNSFKLKG